MAWCERAEEKLLLVYNGIGKWHREGLTEVQWSKFPQRVKDLYPYKPQITKEEFDDFDAVVYRNVLYKIRTAFSGEGKKAKLDEVTYDPDLDGDIS
jgi:hypothetical protein